MTIAVVSTGKPRCQRCGVPMDRPKMYCVTCAHREPIMRTAAKIDANQHEIVEAFRAHGCSVQSLAATGKGVPDLLVGYLHRTHLVEVKDGSKVPSERRLTTDQVTWHGSWEGEPVYIASDVGSAMRMIEHWRIAG